MIKNNKLIFSLFILTIVLVAFGQVLLRQKNISKNANDGGNGIFQYEKKTQFPSVSPKPKKVYVEVDFGENSKKLTGESDGKNALEVMKEITAKENLEVETQQFKYGSMVIRIGDKKNTNDQYWVYFVNDQPGQIASDYYGVYPGQKVLWKYTKNSK